MKDGYAVRNQDKEEYLLKKLIKEKGPLPENTLVRGIYLGLVSAILYQQSLNGIRSRIPVQYVSRIDPTAAQCDQRCY